MKDVQDEARALTHQFVTDWVESGHPPHVLAEKLITSGAALLCMNIGDDDTAELLLKMGIAISRTSNNRDGTLH